VEVEQGFAEYQDIALGAEISDELSSADLRYEWTVTPEGVSMSSDSTRTIRVNCSGMGTYEARVTVKDVRGLVLGSATASIPITVSIGEIRKSEEKREYPDLLR